MKSSALRKPVFAGMLAGMVIFILACLTTWLLYTLNNNLQLQLLKEELANLARITAVEINVEEQKKFTKPEDTNSIAYKEIITPLVKIHNAVPDIRYIYTMREIDGAIYYILDTSNDKRLIRNEGLESAKVMDKYDFDPEDAAYINWLPSLHDGKIHVDEELYFANNSYFITASVPIFENDGTFFGLLGVDFDVSLFKEKRQLLLNIAYLVILLSLILAIAIGFWVYVITKNLVITHLELFHQARTDFLTGACNRRAFIELVEQEMARTNRHHHPLTMLLIDIDHFKNVNDTYGHLTGDEVLIFLVKLVKELKRTNDIIARFGGEEFSILLPDTDRVGAMVYAERLRKRLADMELTSQDGEKFNITISTGLSQYQSGLKLDTWFQQADEAMYKAKDSGRNKIIDQQAKETTTFSISASNKEHRNGQH